MKPLSKLNLQMMISRKVGKTTWEEFKSFFDNQIADSLKKYHFADDDIARTTYTLKEVAAKFGYEVDEYMERIVPFDFFSLKNILYPKFDKRFFYQDLFIMAIKSDDKGEAYFVPRITEKGLYYLWSDFILAL